MPLLTNQASRLLGGGRLPTPVPTLGAELLANPGFETGNPPTSWTAVTTTTFEQSTAQVHGGAASCHIVSSAINGGARQSATLTMDSWYLIGGWFYAVSGTTQRIRIANANNLTRLQDISPNTWTQVLAVERCTLGGGAVVTFGPQQTPVENYIDDVSIRPITLASMFSVRPYSTHTTTKAAVTVTAGTRSGVVCNLDSATAPANFVIASHDGSNARLTQCVAGVYTELISTAVTYVAGAYVEIRRPAGGDVWQLFYNGSQVGTNQTISDSAIKAATLAGMFNTYSGNGLSGFSCVPS